MRKASRDLTGSHQVEEFPFCYYNEMKCLTLSNLIKKSVLSSLQYCWSKVEGSHLVMAISMAGSCCGSQRHRARGTEWTSVFSGLSCKASRIQSKGFYHDDLSNFNLFPKAFLLITVIRLHFFSFNTVQWRLNFNRRILGSLSDRI